jgi:hypothetical protein
MGSVAAFCHERGQVEATSGSDARERRGHDRLCQLQNRDFKELIEIYKTDPAIIWNLLC